LNTRRRSLFGAALLVVMAWACASRPSDPAPWIDEGLTLQGPLNLTRFGEYAMRSSEGFRTLDQPLIANGPGVVIPLSGIMAVFGHGFWTARAAIAAIAACTFIIFFALARRLYGHAAALIASACLLCLPFEGFVYYGRQVIGVVPGLAYFLAGWLLLVIALERNNRVWATGAALGFSLAMATKGQYALVLPVLMAGILTDAFYFGRLRLSVLVTVTAVTFAGLAVWFAVQFAIVGVEHFGQHLASIRRSAAVSVFAFRPMRIPGNVWYLASSGMLLVVLPGLGAAVVGCRRRSLESLTASLLASFVSVWLGWYVFASVGWHRYAFDAYAVGAILAGPVVLRTWTWLQSIPSRIDTMGPRHWTMVALASLWLVVLAGAATATSVRQLRTILSEPDRSAEQFAAHLLSVVPSDRVVESWEWELDAMVDLTFHHPTNEWVDLYTASTQFNEPVTVTYDPSAFAPSFLVDGAFSKYTGLYRPFLDSGCCDRVASIGAYDLYRVRGRGQQGTSGEVVDGGDSQTRP
jgi:4-amino-4-deoxy-L-arabinose transferase-like glycosyltransferase